MNKRNRNLLFSAGILIVIAIFSLGYRWGIQSGRSVTAAQTFRIAGDSMAPTLRDHSLCKIGPIDTLIQRGDVVAVQWDAKPRVKRIAAIGGDSVDVSRGRLLINGERLEDLIAGRIAQAAPNESLLVPATVAVNASRDHWHRSKITPDWIVLTHHNVHQAGRVTPILDDYPSNQNVRRMLNKVDRLIVRIHQHDNEVSIDRGTLENASIDIVSSAFPVVFDAEPTPIVTTTDAGIARFREAKTAGTSTDPPIISEDLARQLVSETQPIAVRISSADQMRCSIHVKREIEYRGLQQQSPIQYPLLLESDEVFVVGDNVPVSVDSRTVGPIKTSEIIGLVSPE